MRFHSLLEDAGIKLSVFVSDITGTSARRMLAALVGGERDPPRGASRSPSLNFRGAARQREAPSRRPSFARRGSCRRPSADRACCAKPIALQSRRVSDLSPG
jgi:hypothetical protein